jgi:benzoyl-CoA-dihydrodiol lyase
MSGDGRGEGAPPSDSMPRVEFRVHPSRYRHWRVSVEGPVATLTMDVDEAGGLASGYQLKLNSYDLGVDIELYDAVQRLRFEHPDVRTVVITSGKERIFCAGANIRMLAGASHAWKVNFCKFTNETRSGIEDATANSGQSYLAALNGTASGGGYELALACEEILLIDDRSSTVSLPELPLLGVLPGTGGLTRLLDKRHVRRDLADYVSTRPEGVGGSRAVAWRLVDQAVPRHKWAETVAARAALLASRSGRRVHQAGGCPFSTLEKTRQEALVSYRHVAARFDRAAGAVHITVSGPDEDAPADGSAAHQLGDRFWPLAVARELDDLILDLRINELELGTWVFHTEGDPDRVLAHDRVLLEHTDDWLAKEIVLYLKRTLKRLDVTSRSLIALVESGSCYAGVLLELVLAADRTFHMAGIPEESGADVEPATIIVGPMNLGPLAMGNGLTRLQTRFWGNPSALAAVEAHAGEPLPAEKAEALGLVTFAPDDMDWDEEVRIAVEERAGFSADALTGLEANCRFAGPESMETKIFGRLSAWQNWIFNRPNAAGPGGALKRFGTGQRPEYDRTRV